MLRCHLSLLHYDWQHYYKPRPLSFWHFLFSQKAPSRVAEFCALILRFEHATIVARDASSSPSSFNSLPVTSTPVLVHATQVYLGAFKSEVSASSFVLLDISVGTPRRDILQGYYVPWKSRNHVDLLLGNRGNFKWSGLEFFQFRLIYLCAVGIFGRVAKCNVVFAPSCWHWTEGVISQIVSTFWRKDSSHPDM